MHKYTWRTGILEAVMVLVGLIFMFPLYILVTLAFKAPGDQANALLPTLEPTFANFTQAWDTGGLGGALLNSAWVTIISVTAIVLMSAAAAYPLSRVGARWSKFTYFAFLAGLLLPAQLGLLPLYQTMRDLGLLGSLWSVIIVSVGSSMPFSIFLYSGFLRALPPEYEEAASLDGAGAFRSFWSIVFPLVRPITGTIIILNAVAIWNEFMTPLLYLSNSSTKTITVAINGFVGQYGAQWNLIFAGIIISILPILLAYFLLQKYIVQGFASGLKG